MAFNGFSKDTFQFLTELEANNTKDWFDENRARYEAIWKGEALDFIDAMLEPMAALNPSLKAEARLNGSLRRINRDVRFGKDKTPYNPRLHLIFWAGSHPNRSAAFHLVIHPDGIGFGAGVFGLTPEQLKAYRNRIIAPVERVKLLDAIEVAKTTGVDFGETDLVKLPKGYEADGDWEHLLRRKAIVMRTSDHLKTPKWIHSADAVAEVSKIATAMEPLIRWLA